MKKSTTLSLAILVLLIGFGLVWFFALRGDSVNESQRVRDQKQAINAANLFEPVGDCETSQTNAVHRDSGAEYTFATNCLPAGWTVATEATNTGENAEDSDSTKPSNTTPRDVTPVAPIEDKERDTPPMVSPGIPDPVQPPSELDPVEAALREARNYQPKGNCTTVMTPARHIESGAIYTFTSGCIPAGWERIRSGV